MVVAISGIAIVGLARISHGGATAESGSGQESDASKAHSDNAPDARDDGDEAAEAADELRDEVRSALKLSLRTLAAAPFKETRSLLEVYTRLESDESLPSGERLRLQIQLRTRLAQAKGAIARGLRRKNWEQRIGNREEGIGNRGQATTESHHPAGNREQATVNAEQAARGGNPQNDAKELIELIEDTIAPESWEIRGGRGVIRYWSNGQALVIRQTAEVHERIGGVLEGIGNR
jgi:hypothetical protein